MRKIIIAICSVMLASSAMAVPDRIKNIPKQTKPENIEAWDMVETADKADKGEWLSITSNNFQSVKGIFAPNWQFNTVGGTYGQHGNSVEGSIVPIIAHKIYEHGGEFCMTQMQAGFGKNTGQFIDYFTNNRYKCQTICEPGWKGESCKEQGYECLKETPDYKQDLNNREDGSYRLLSGYNDDQVKDQEVFGYRNGGTDSNGSGALVLGILEIKKHSVIASPVYVMSSKNTIYSAWSKEVFQKLLCAPGYEANDDGDDCKLSSYCEQVAELCEEENLNSFDENKNHEWATKTENGKTCKYIACKSGYGFKEGTSSKECEKCETTRIQGVNTDGICKKCTGPNQMFNGTECKNYDTYSIQQLKKGIQNVFDCWMETGRENYKKCFECRKTWYKNAKTCQ